MYEKTPDMPHLLILTLMIHICSFLRPSNLLGHRNMAQRLKVRTLSHWLVIKHSKISSIHLHTETSSSQVRHRTARALLRLLEASHIHNQHGIARADLILLVHRVRSHISRSKAQGMVK